MCHWSIRIFVWFFFMNQITLFKIYNSFYNNEQNMLSWGMGFCWNHIEIFFLCFRLLLRKTRLSHLNFFYSNKFSFVSHIWACLSANITLHNWNHIKNIHTKCFTKNEPVELTYHKAGLLMQYPRKYKAKKVMKLIQPVYF
jgi:hypothetical protein